MERELKASIARLYQNYDFVTDEYDRLFDIVDSVREDYNNTKSLFLYHRYHEFKRLIKNAIRKWRAVEKRNSLAVSRKQSNASFALAIQTGSLNRGLNPGLPGIPEENSNSYSGNLNARLRANKGLFVIILAYRMNTKMNNNHDRGDIMLLNIVIFIITGGMQCN